MMTVDVDDRIDIKEIKNHPWIKKYPVAPSGDAPMNDVIINNLLKFKGKSILKRELISLLVKNQSFSQLEELRKHF